MEDERKVIQKKENPIVMGLYITFWVSILVMFFLLFLNQMESYNTLRADLTRLEAEVAQAQAEAYSLELQLTLFDSDVYLEYLARRRGMVRPNEIVFRNVAD